ncbi:hypothetical protein [Streptomyces sp. NPDC017673]|uniref:hypothetical protein n=1 Tax=unclassified Streptomyces TaxID=2593676 RepID=UPI003794C072
MHSTLNLGAAIFGVFGALVLAFLALASPGALEEMSFGPFKARWRISQVESRVESIQLAIVGLLTRHERRHLRKLAGETRDGVNYWEKLHGELEHLEHLGYLRYRPDRPDPELLKMKDNLKDGEYFLLGSYLEITKMGTEYLRLYRESAPLIKVGSTGEVNIDGKSYGEARDWRDIVRYAIAAGWIMEPDWEEEVIWADGVRDRLKPGSGGLEPQPRQDALVSPPHRQPRKASRSTRSHHRKTSRSTHRKTEAR